MVESGKKVTIKHVAEKAGVSPATVSLVVQGKGNLKDETRETVKRAIQETGYLRKPLVSQYEVGKQYVLIVDDISNPYFHSLYKGLDKGLSEAGHFATLLSSNDSVARQTHLLNDLWSCDIGGVILVPATGTKEDDLQVCANRAHPVILAVRRIGQTSFGYVGANPTVGMQIATNRLIALGNRNIAFVGGYQSNYAYGERYAGFATSLMNHKLQLNADFIINGGSTREFGREAAEKLLGKHNRPEAIIAYNDLVAIGVLDAIYAAGLQPGKDVAVIGYDDIPEAALQRVPLTTVATPAFTLGEVIAQAIKNRTSDGTEDNPIDISYPPRLIIRESCGGAMQSSNSNTIGDAHGSAADI